MFYGLQLNLPIVEDHPSFSVSKRNRFYLMFTLWDWPWHRKENFNNPCHFPDVCESVACSFIEHTLNRPTCVIVNASWIYHYLSHLIIKIEWFRAWSCWINSGVSQIAETYARIPARRQETGPIEEVYETPEEKQCGIKSETKVSFMGTFVKIIHLCRKSHFSNSILKFDVLATKSPNTLFNMYPLTDLADKNQPLFFLMF